MTDGPDQARSVEITPGAAMIAAERQRQMDVEGWTPEHDADEHADGELLLAAQCYLLVGRTGATPNQSPASWPWHSSWWKPSPDRVRNLVRAGALIAAEIDRIERGRAS